MAKATNQGAWTRRARARGMRRIEVWMPGEVVEAIDRRVAAGGYQGRGEWLTALVRSRESARTGAAGMELGVASDPDTPQPSAPGSANRSDRSKTSSEPLVVPGQAPGYSLQKSAEATGSRGSCWDVYVGDELVGCASGVRHIRS